MPQDFVLEPIDVTGQRRINSGLAFPVLPPLGPWTLPNAVRDDNLRGPMIPPRQIIPFRTKWNADATGAQAAPEFLTHAQGLGGVDAGGGVSRTCFTGNSESS